jgi:thiamine pyrophosphate-dependent acetolactate synthase large subunit-like protein
MDLFITPDIYTPSINDNGNYVDHMPIIKHGIYCSCGSRKDKVYENVAKFAHHVKSKTHQKWLEHLNQNKANYYVEMLKTKELAENQQKIIAQMETQLHKKSLTIDYLTEQLTREKTQQSATELDLLDFN